MKQFLEFLQRNIDAVVVGNGEFPTHEIPLQILKNNDFVVCCDGGANEYIKQGNIPQLIIGDGDSLSPENRVRFSHILKIVDDQETNDQTKAVNHLISENIKNIAIVGATGKREDHILGNISLLMEYRRKGVEVRMFTNYGVFIPCRDAFIMPSVPGLQVSIFNIKATEFTAEGLKYPIYDFTALWQGTLNECIAKDFTINAKGEYLLYVTYSSKEQED